jgi:hypothetical protein
MYDDDETYDRREILKWLGVTILGVILAPLGLAGCGGGEEEELQMDQDSGSSDQASSDGGSSSGGGSGQSDKTHEVPHPSDAKLSEAEKTGESLGGAQRSPGGKSPKDGPSVMYQHEPSGNKSCGNCDMYVKDQNGDGYGACTMVEGEIHPCDFCVLYTEHPGDKAVACGA